MYSVTAVHLLSSIRQCVTPAVYITSSAWKRQAVTIYHQTLYINSECFVSMAARSCEVCLTGH